MSVKVVVDDTPEKTIRISKQEINIIQAASEGKTSKEIANETGISVRTVETHKRRLMKRLGCKNIPHLIGFFFREKILKINGNTTTEHE